jgi:Flp pilus assembly protein TadB
VTRRLTDTGKAIDADLQRRFGRAQTEQEIRRRQFAEDEAFDAKERPAHPVAALGSTFLMVGALVVALTVTSLFFVASIVAVPALIGALLLFGGYAFLSYGQRRKARRESSTLPGAAEPGE